MTTTTTPFTVEDVLNVLRPIIEADPNHKNPDADVVDATCRYVEEDGSPSCIAGTAIAALGLPLVAFDDRYQYESVDDLIAHMGYPFTIDAGVLLQEFQANADANMTWGDVLADYDEEYAA